MLLVWYMQVYFYTAIEFCDKGEAFDLVSKVGVVFGLLIDI